MKEHLPFIISISVFFLASAIFRLYYFLMGKYKKIKNDMEESLESNKKLMDKSLESYKKTLEELSKDLNKQLRDLREKIEPEHSEPEIA